MRRNRHAGLRGVPSEPRTVHSEHCPFCGADFDPRDLDQVLEHFDHQVEAGVPAIDETSEEDQRPTASDIVEGRVEKDDHGKDKKILH